jgi:hypothetical protein
MNGRFYLKRSSAGFLCLVISFKFWHGNVNLFCGSSNLLVFHNLPSLLKGWKRAEVEAPKAFGAAFLVGQQRDEGVASTRLSTFQQIQISLDFSRFIVSR